MDQQPTGSLMQMAAAPHQGMLEAGNIDLTNRPHVRNPDGSISTVRSIGIEDNGVNVVIPTVSPDGKVLSNADAIALYRKTGQHLGKFKTQAQADAFAEALHQSEAQKLMPTSQPLNTMTLAAMAGMPQVAPPKLFQPGGSQ